ncbi:hypothetical protein KEM60_00300 [Austwickia sp. TVS 96-490-7B]|uniref:hypothetical protein n=1 Tax=Austwickia sp. TVS 96-490-7B TaxID=2830843 RepID=UPI001C588734|nr:hypothetical protein [Austwickia sp. TVS 96-490-7B]MBW3084117.1 hypothetical protein [Austwickia sp. TVS 96-490-7B]
MWRPLHHWSVQHYRRKIKGVPLEGGLPRGSAEPGVRVDSALVVWINLQPTVKIGEVAYNEVVQLPLSAVGEDAHVPPGRKEGDAMRPTDLLLERLKELSRQSGKLGSQCFWRSGSMSSGGATIAPPEQMLRR